MHGAPPWCVDSGAPGSVQQNFLIAQGDKFVGDVVNEITASSLWQSGNNAIVVTFDEGNTAKSQILDHCHQQSRRAWRAGQDEL